VAQTAVGLKLKLIIRSLRKRERKVAEIKFISIKTLKNILSGNVRTPLNSVILFHSPKCGYCAPIRPLFQQANKEYEDTVFLTFNASQHIMPVQINDSTLSHHHGPFAKDEPQKIESMTYISDIFDKLNDVYTWHEQKYKVPIQYGMTPFVLKVKTGYAPHVSHVRMLVEPKDWNPTEHEDLIFDMQHLRDFIENDSKKVLTIK